MCSCFRSSLNCSFPLCKPSSDYQMQQISPVVQTGWICPNCHISNAPWKSSCCNGKQTTSENSYNVKITGTGTTCL